MMVSKSERDTNIIFRTLHNSGRVLKNVISDEVVATENRPGGCEFKDIHHLVKGVRGRETLEAGTIDNGLVWGGQVVGLIDDIPTCKVLLQRMVNECRDQLSAALSAFK
jgi:nitronate monooxygenase